MGIFGAIKNKFLHKEENLSDFRSHVLGEPNVQELPGPPGPGIRPGEQNQNMDQLGPLPNSDLEHPEQDLGPLPDSLEDFGTTDLSKPIGPVKEPIEMSMDNERDAREIIHRLEFIENQLSAIKSQTETVNERLKNIEVKIDRRYR